MGTERRKTVSELLAAARLKLPKRLTPAEAKAEMKQGALLVDIRNLEQRISDGDIPGALHIHRNVFEWRCDPASPWRDEHIRPHDHNQRLIVLCNEGYQSSLAAANLQVMGVKNATDVAGGFTAWKAAGLPVVPHRTEG